MNDRIENLAQGCFEYIEGTLDGDIVEFDYKKFAELIVRECATVTSRAENSDTDIRCTYDVITEHFGVKE